MVTLDEAVLADPARLGAVRRLRRVMPALPLPLDAIARLAARLTGTPMAAITLVAQDEEYLAGVYGLPEPLSAGRSLPLKYSVCKYVVSADHMVRSDDMLGGADPQLAGHLLVTDFGLRSFLGVPIRDGGRPVGSLTVLDTGPRHWTDEQAAALLAVADLLRLPVPAGPPSAEVATLDSEVLLDSLQEAFLAVNPDGVVVGFNRAAEDLLGYSAAEVCGRHIDDTVAPDYDGKPIDVSLGRLFAASPAHRVLRRISLRHCLGHRVPAEASMSVVRGATGALACVFLTDLARQDAADVAADRHDRFLDALLESLAVGVVACDADGEVVLMNRPLREIMDLPVAGAVPDAYPLLATRILLDADHRPMSWDQAPLRRAWRGEQVTGCDVLVQVPGRRMRTFTSTAQPITDAAGRSLGAVAVAHEVTALRRAERFRACHTEVEAALQAAGSAHEASPAILQAVCTSLGWPGAELWLIDEGSGDLQSVGSWNTPGADFSEFFGHPAEKGFGITGRVWATGQPIWVPDIGAPPATPTDREQVLVDACIRRGIRTVLGVPVRDGGTLLGVLTCFAGAPEHHEDLLTVLLDGVAAQIGVYVALRRAEALARQLARTKDDFIALVSHEMRTPLTSIVANATMLADDAGQLDDECRTMLVSVVRNATTLSDVIDTLLELAGLDSGYLNLVVRRVDLAGIVTDALHDLRGTAAEVGVRLGADRPEPLWIDGDAHRLRQVVDDLLSNAVKYSPHGGDVQIGLRADGQLVELTVTDPGLGMPAEEREQVFDRFFRGSNVRHQGTPGNGLGLSLARTIVELHGGTIRLTEHHPQGTTVLVRLPMQNSAVVIDRVDPPP
ncbi:ATP-binding protein [Micromonosporaceae bacterium Da 78-11]